MKKSNPRIIRNYTTLSGKVPFLEWLYGLKDSTTRLRIRRRLDRVELGNFGDHKPIGDGVYELKFDFGPGHRIYYAESDDVIVILLCAGNKSAQHKDIKIAKLYWQELKERCNE